MCRLWSPGELVLCGMQYGGGTESRVRDPDRSWVCLSRGARSTRVGCSCSCRPPRTQESDVPCTSAAESLSSERRGPPGAGASSGGPSTASSSCSSRRQSSSGSFVIVPFRPPSGCFCCLSPRLPLPCVSLFIVLMIVFPVNIWYLGEVKKKQQYQCLFFQFFQKIFGTWITRGQVPG